MQYPNKEQTTITHCALQTVIDLFIQCSKNVSANPIAAWETKWLPCKLGLQQQFSAITHFSLILIYQQFVQLQTGWSLKISHNVTPSC